MKIVNKKQKLEVNHITHVLLLDIKHVNYLEFKHNILGGCFQIWPLAPVWGCQIV